MNTVRYFLLISLLFLMRVAVTGQIYPVTTHVNINPPTTTYLTDFTTPGSERLSVNLFFNDFNEAYYDVRLKVSIEGNGISLVTHPSYVPPRITLIPGANLFSGSDLANYLNPANLLINGIRPEALQQNGTGLPEGLYTFCVQVFDYGRPDVALSINQCNTRLLRKNHPPTMVAPACNSTIPVLAGNNDILFQWHSNADLAIQTLYELSLVEVPPGMNPDDAMNGTSTKILDSEPVMGTSFLYGPNQLPLEVGKRYAYRVKAIDIQGLTTFENNGLSPVCAFYYGVDGNGMVPLVSPLFNDRISVTNQQTFRWDRPGNALPGQQVYYKLKIVKLFDGQDPKIALEFNPAWYEVTTPVLPGNSAEVLPPSLYPLPAEEQYAWEVKAYSENNGVEQEVAVSEQRVFYTAPAVEKFKAGNPDPNLITVLSLSKNEDLANNQKKISGVGTMKIRENGEEVQLHFNDIIVGPYQDYWQLVHGTIVEPLNNFIVRLDNSGNPAGDPANMDNYGRADFDATQVIVEKDDLKLRGRVKWQFPHATADGQPVLQSVDTAILYNRYKLINAYVAVEGNTFDLLDPYGFTITYHPSAAPGSSTGSNTKFALYDNILTLTLDGEVLTPASVADMGGNRVAYPFQQADNPYYFTQSGIGAAQDILLVQSTQIQLDGTTAVFDLSEDSSPQKITTNTWKGIYFEDFNFKFPTNFDLSNQLVLEQEQVFSFSALPTNDFYAWVDPYGVDCYMYRSFTGSTGPEAAFNTFKDNIREIQIELTDNTVDDCFIKGFIHIPLLDPHEEFTYNIPFDNNGLQTSFLDDDLIDRVATLRPNSDELRLHIIVKQAVFRDNERLDLVIDLDWEAIQTYIPNLTQFKIWGNGEIGFNVPGGARGITNVVGRFDNSFEITVDSVAAGLFGGTYAFNCITSMLLSDEKVAMSGQSPTSPPKANFLTDEERIPSSGNGPPNMLPVTNYLGQDHWNTYNNGAAEEIDRGELVLFIPFRFCYPMVPNGLYGAGSLAAIAGRAGASAGGATGAGEGVGGGLAAGGAAYASSYILKQDPTVTISGFLLYTKDDPDWGNVFAGKAKVAINKPTKYAIQAKLIIGKRQGVHYGLFEMFYNANAVDYSTLGNIKNGVTQAVDLAKEVQLKKSVSPTKAKTQNTSQKAITIGSYQIVEIGGRFYWNMSHSVEEECGENFTSLIQLGASPVETEGTSVNYAELTGYFTDEEIINGMSHEKISEMMCQLRSTNRKGLRTLLNGLPSPDFDFLANEVTEIPQSVWNTLKAANVTSYSHLELLFPDDWCPHIMPAVVKAAAKAWDDNHHGFGEPPGWGEHLTNQQLRPDFGHFEEMSGYYKIKTLREMQRVHPAEEAYFINNNILTQVQWDSMVAENAVDIPRDQPIDWYYIYKSFNYMDWDKMIPSFIDLDWTNIWGTWLKEDTKVELTLLLEQHGPNAWEKLKALPLGQELSQLITSGASTAAIQSLTNYRVDNSVDFGFMITARMQDLATQGMSTMVKGTLEMSFGNGTFEQFLLRVDAGMGNRPNPSDIDGSFIKGKACITYTRATQTFIADFQAQAIVGVGSGGICGQGLLHIEKSPDETHVELGKKEFPIMVARCPVGEGFIGWFEIHKVPDSLNLGAGLGFSYSAFLQTPRIGSDVCSIYGYFNAYAAIALFADLQIEPELQLLQAGIMFGAGVDIGVNFSGPFCPFGDINILHLYLGGELVLNFPQDKMRGTLVGEASLFGCIEATFRFSVNESIPLP